MPHALSTDLFTNPLADLPSDPSGGNVPDRRQDDRRGSLVPVHRFGDERRRGDERRTRSRRGFDRHPIELMVELRYGGEATRALTVDLSVLGTSLGDGPPLPIGTLVRLTFELPDDLEEFPLMTWAQVVSHDGDGVLGYRFVGLRPCDARRIGRLLAPREGLALASGHRF
ncbi:MAG: PilZ domain-containing protein [Deltaproteobacteria bacterium]|nr:PilZ domain-containing protein [Deltaproteobacteria bacterium]